MIQQISRGVVIGYNRFDPSRAVKGWVNETTAYAHEIYHTSEFIDVVPDDIVYFGAAVITQGWHLVTYTKNKQSIRRVTLNNGVRVFQALDEQTAILQYRVEPEVYFIRVICDTRYLHSFLVSVNKGFTAGEYRSLVAGPQGKMVTKTQSQTLDCWNIIVNCKGSGTITLGDAKCKFTPGTIVCVPPGVPFQKTSPRGFSDIHLHTTSFLLEEPLGGKWMVTRDDPCQSIETLMLLMLRLYFRGEAPYGRMLEQLFNTVEQLLFQHLQEEHPHRHQMERMIEIMKAGYTNPEFSLTQIFEGQNYCPNHLRRLFKEKTGCTPVEYLNQLRINHAQKLLGDTQMAPLSVSQVALMSGFSDPCYFSRIFKKKTGVSPAAFTKKQETNL